MNSAGDGRPEAHPHDLLDTAPDAMLLVGGDGRIRLANVQTERLFDYARSELVGAHLDLLIPARFHGAHADHLTRYLAEPTTRPMGSGLELFGRRKGGEEFPIEVSLSPLRSGGDNAVSASIRDITDRKRIEAATKLNADRLSSAVDSIQDGFALFDANHRLVLCNGAYRRIFGDRVPEPLIGAAATDLIDAWLHSLDFQNEEERAHFRAARFERRSEPTTIFAVRTRDGRSLRVTDRRTADGGFVKTVWDVTDDERAAEELRAARAAAEAASAAKSEFLSSMSHELRTPLNAILGFTQLMQRDKTDPLSRRHLGRLEQIFKGGEHLLHLIDEILDLARVEAGGLSISTEPVDALEMLEEVERTLGPAAAGENVRIRIGTPSSAVPAIYVDRTRFAQIVMNFGSNAIKYNRPGGIVTLALSMPDQDRVRLTVLDDGIGIPIDKQDKVFQPFQRAGQETGPIEGTGIGLAITKRLAELMNGRVGFSSVPGVGSEFWVEVPIHAARAHTSSSPLFVSEPQRGDGRLRGLVLYVEDNPANVAFMKDLLSGFDEVELVTASTAEAGIELSRARRPNVVIMDVNLPGMSGLDALCLLQEIPETSGIPVIALTAAATERDRKHGEAAGFYRYLTKPVKVAELEAALETLLSVTAPTAAGLHEMPFPFH